MASLFGLGAISLCATQEINWTLFATFEATAAFLLAFTAVVRQRRSRALRDEELRALKGRLNVLEACERRRIMQSLRSAPRNVFDTTGLLAVAEDVPDFETKFPIAPKTMSE